MRRVVEPLLRQGVPDPLDDPALDLARRAERVDDAADVVHGRDPVDPHLAGLDVDSHLGDLDAEGEHLHPGGVRPARALAQDLRVLEQRDDLCDRRSDLAGLLRDLLDLAARVRGCGADGGPHRRRRRGAGGDRRVRAVRGVAERHGDVLEWDAELLGGDLGHRGLRAGADVLHRGDHRRPPVGADADPRVARRPAAAVPDLRGHADTALDRRG